MTPRLCRKLPAGQKPAGSSRCSAIDYETEYDNRARVPEHPEIFARWQREAAAYRAAARGRRIGPDLWPLAAPDHRPVSGQDDDDMTPLAMFIHGGWWRSLEPSMFSQIAAGPNARGVTVAVAGYDLCPQVSIAAIIEQMRNGLPVSVAQAAASAFSSTAIPPAGISPPACWRRTGRRLPPTRPPIWCPPPMRFPACSIWCRSRSLENAGPAARRGRSDGACHRCTGKCRAGRTLDAVVGGAEFERIPAPEPHHREGWRARGVETRYEEIAGANHFTVDRSAQRSRPAR